MSLGRIYWVDIPNPERSCDEDAWKNVATFGLLKEAQAFLRDNYGIEEEDSAIFISSGEDCL